MEHVDRECKKDLASCQVLFLALLSSDPPTVAKYHRPRLSLNAQYWQRIVDIEVAVESTTIVAVKLKPSFNQEW
jgi:hypothetical protein